MSVLKKLTLKNIKLNKKRTIVTIIGIMLSVTLITTVASLYSSFIDTLINYQIEKDGDFHVAFYDVESSDVNVIKNNIGVENIYFISSMGFATLNDTNNKEKPYAHVYGFSKKAFDNLALNITEGRLPTSENEIVVTTNLRTEARITMNVGDNISLDVGDRVSDENEILNNRMQYINYDNKSEKLENTDKKEFTIVGKIERPSGYIEDPNAAGYSFITYLDDNSILNKEKMDVFVKLNKKGLKDAQKIVSDILDVDKKIISDNISMDRRALKEYKETYNEGKIPKYEYNIANYLIQLQTNPLNADDVGNIGKYVVSTISIIILITSVFCIRNSFEISIAEKTKLYGMLKSVGATKKQIKKNVLLEAGILGLYGIPIGIVVGNGITALLVFSCNKLLFENTASRFRMAFSVSWIAILIGVVLGIVTIYLSAIKSARKAANISSIELIKNSAGIKVKAKKIKGSKIVSKVFGVGGTIAYKNIKRNKKRLRTTIVSIILSTSTFIAVSFCIDYLKKGVEHTIQVSDYNMELRINKGADSDVLKEKVMATAKLDNIDDYTMRRLQFIYVKDIKYSDKYVKLAEPEENDYISIIAIGDYQYKKYLKQLNLDYNELKDKAIFVQKEEMGKYPVPGMDALKRAVYQKYDYSKGDILDIGETENEDKDVENKEKVKNDEIKNMKMKVGFVTDKKVFAGKNNEIIVSDEMFDKLFPENDVIQVNYLSSNLEQLQKDIEGILSGEEYQLENDEKSLEDNKKSLILISIFLYGFVGIVSLIGITNIFNTITNTMSLRRKEFATLKSVGMTKKEFSRMIRLESILMCIKSLIYGTIIGVLASYGIHLLLREQLDIGFSFPLMSIIVCIIVVLLLIVILMKYSMSKINKDNIIETIRNENI